MQDPEATTDATFSQQNAGANPPYWRAPNLDPARALPPYSGYRPGDDAALPPLPALPDDDTADIGRPRRSRLAGCLWLGITALVILSLIGTTFLTYHAVRQEASRSQDLLQSAGQTSASLTEKVRRETNAPLSATAAPPLPTTAATVAPVVAAEQATEPALNRLVLVNARGQLEVVDPDGTDRQQLTDFADGIIYQFPAWSPDGRAVAAIGTSRNGGGVYVYDPLAASASPEEASPYFSATQLPIYLYWSPNSSDIAFLAGHARDTMGLSVVAGSGETESQVIATGSPMYWAWADDSEMMLLHAGAENDAGRLVAIDTSGQEQTENLAQPGQFLAPGISASGRYWTYAEDEGQGTSTLVIANTGTGQRRLVEQAGSVAMTWSPTEEKLAYTSGRVDSHPFWGALRLVDAATGDTKLLTTDTVLAFFWSPDGTQIAYLTINSGREEDRYAKANATIQRVGLGAQPTQQRGSALLALSVVDTATGQGLHLTDFQPTIAFATQFMPFFAQYALSHSLWSPDSSALAIPVFDGTENVVMVVPVSGATPRSVGAGDMAFWSRR